MSAKVKCAICNDIIQSKHRHDFVRCGCGAIFVDGGDDYLRVGGYEENIIILNEDGEEPLKSNADRPLDV